MVSPTMAWSDQRSQRTASCSVYSDSYELPSIVPRPRHLASLRPATTPGGTPGSVLAADLAVDVDILRAIVQLRCDTGRANE